VQSQIDTGREKIVLVGGRGSVASLKHVGYGVSQMLPIVVQSILSKNETIFIQQPELHVHPRLQAEFGDLFASTIHESCGNQFVVETHSEHLMLRIQRLIAGKQLHPDQVSVVYVDNCHDGSNAIVLRLDDDGQFIDPWPGGFFPERLHEMFGI